MARKVFDIDPASQKKAKAVKASGESVSVPVREARETPAKPRQRRKSNMLRIAEELAQEQALREDDKTALLETFYAEKQEMGKKERKEEEGRVEGTKHSERPDSKKVRRFTLKKMRKPFAIVVGIALVTGGVYAAGVAAANVHIVLETQKDAQDQNFAITLQEGASADSTSIVPLQLSRKDFSYTKAFSATGTSTGEFYVVGTVSVYNEAQQTPQVLVQGTRFVSPDGLIFRSVQRIAVPGYTFQNGKAIPGTVDVSVKADRPGSAYAIAPARFTLPGLQGTAKYAKIYAVSNRQFAYDTAGARSVTAEDIKNAKQSVAQEAFDATKADLLKSLPDSVKLLDQALQIQVTNVETSARPGDQIAQFNTSINGTVSLMAFDERDITRFVAERMPQFAIQSDLVAPVYRFSYADPQIDFAKKQMQLTVRASREVTVLLDNLSLRQRVSGKSLRELRTDLIAIPGLERVQISVWPFWVTQVPSDIDKITVEVK